MNVDFTSDMPLDDTSGLAVTFGSQDAAAAGAAAAAVCPNDVSNKLSETSLTASEASKVGQKRRLSTEATAVEPDANSPQNVGNKTSTPADVDANGSQLANPDEP